jgi:hypothetical protein
MANVRLLRQRLSDYDAAIQRINRNYEGDYEEYGAKVNAWNAIASKTPYVTQILDTSPTQIGDGDPLGGAGKLVRLSDGQRVVLDAGPVEGLVEGAYYNGPSSSQVPTGEVDAYGQPIMKSVTTHGFSKLPAAAGPLPEDPVMPDAPREPNLTQRDVRTLMAPPTNAAGVEMARAKGYTGNSELVAENEDRSRITAFQSAFDNPDNPQALKDRGILAKTLAGKL